MEPAGIPGLLLDTAPDAIVVSRSDGLITLANRRAHDMFGYPAGELVGHSVDELVPDDARERHPELRAAYSSGVNTSSGAAFAYARPCSGLRIAPTAVASGWACFAASSRLPVPQPISRIRCPGRRPAWSSSRRWTRATPSSRVSGS